MEPEQAKQLGAYLRDRRRDLGLSTRQLAAEASVNDVTISRIERGEFAAPRPDKLSRITEALGLRLADVFALAGYVTPGDLPAIGPYLRARYRDLPDETIDRIARYATRQAKKHGVALTDPALAGATGAEQ